MDLRKRCFWKGVKVSMMQVIVFMGTRNGYTSGKPLQSLTTSLL